MPRAKSKEPEMRTGAVTETVQRMSLSELHPFERHPFKVLDGDSMAETVESIRQMGVANPLIVRPDPDGGYEIISGHRRHHAAELTGLDTIPVIVREPDDDSAFSVKFCPCCPSISSQSSFENRILRMLFFRPISPFPASPFPCTIRIQHSPSFPRWDCPSGIRPCRPTPASNNIPFSHFVPSSVACLSCSTFPL